MTKYVLRSRHNLDDERTSENGMPTAVSNNVTTLQPSRRGLASLSSEDFFKLMVSELRNQDPLEPAKTADMIGQVSQIRSIELNGKLAETLDQLSRQQRTGGMADLMGKFVRAVITDDQGVETTREGVVTAVRFERDGSAILELDTGDAVPADAVTHVSTLEQLAAGTESSRSAKSAQAAAATRGSGDLPGAEADPKAAARSARPDRKPPWFTLGGILNL